MKGETMATDTGKAERVSSASHRIAVGVDGSENSIGALEWAATQAQRTGAVLEIVSAFGPGYQYLSRDEADECMQSDVDDALARAKGLVPEIEVASTIFEGPPEVALMREGAEADLLVVGSRGRDSCWALSAASVYTVPNAQSWLSRRLASMRVQQNPISRPQPPRTSKTKPPTA